jgi:hypothetical protein
MGSPHASAGSSSTKFITYLIITEKETMFYVTTRRGAAKTIARMTNYAEMVFHGKTIRSRNAKARKVERQFDLRAYGAGYTACVSKELIMVSVN